MNNEKPSLKLPHDLPEEVTSCIAVLLGHLKEFKLDALFDGEIEMKSFASVRTMVMNGSTINNLEILRNSNNGSETGSLLWGKKKKNRNQKKIMKIFCGCCFVFF